MKKKNLNSLFEPKSIAVIGASTQKGKLGYDVFENLAQLGYKGKLFPVNPKGGELLGFPIFTKISEINQKIDLAVILVPAQFVMKVLAECGEAKIQNIVIISAGFKEIGGEGIEREKEIKKLVKKHKFNLIGPNCLGIINTNHKLNASFAEGMPNSGNVSLISQSGAMAVAISDWAYTNHLGFSKIISLGNKAGINEIDLLQYLAQDKTTDVILMYLESIENGQEFIKIAQKVTKKKPIIVIKSGISKRGTKAISSHTGSLAGSNDAVETAFQQSGIIRAETVEDLFDYARGFSYQKTPQNNRVAIISNAGGPAIIATDNIEKRNLELAELSSKTLAQLKKNLPATASLNNPIDIVGDALANRYESALKSVLQDKNVDSVLVLLTPQIMTEEMETANLIKKFNQKYPHKTILTCFMGGKNIEEAEDFLSQNKIPNFAYPHRAVQTLEKMAFFTKWQKHFKNPLAVPCETKRRREGAGGCKTANNNRCNIQISKDIIIKIRKKLKNYQGQIPMSLAFQLLELYKIYTPDADVAKNPTEAIKIADKIGYPVVLKICSDEIIHKTDAGGVRVNLKNAKELTQAYKKILQKVKKYNSKAKINGMFVQEMTTIGREVIIGMKRDPQFGPLLMFGLGGIYVEVLKDVTFRVAPISFEDAEKMISEIKAIKLLRGVRGEKSIDFQKLATVICHISQMVTDFPEIQELDLNPLIVREKGKEALAIDARILV